jgi:hypothetical protein
MNKNRDFQIGMPLAIGSICFLLGFGMIAFGLYFLPHVVFGWNYEVPLAIHQLSHWVETHHNLSGYSKAAAIIVPFFILAALFLSIARILTVVEEHRYERTDEHDAGNKAKFAAGNRETGAVNEKSKKEAKKYTGVYLLLVLGIAFFLLIEFFLFYSIY